MDLNFNTLVLEWRTSDKVDYDYDDGDDDDNISPGISEYLKFNLKNGIYSIVRNVAF